MKRTTFVTVAGFAAVVVLIAGAARGAAATAGETPGSGVTTGPDAWTWAQDQQFPAGQLPYVMGLTQREAEKRLEAAGYANVHVANPGVPVIDLVLDMQPLAGTAAPGDTWVKITLAEVPPSD